MELIGSIISKAKSLFLNDYVRIVDYLIEEHEKIDKKRKELGRIPYNECKNYNMVFRQKIDEISSTSEELTLLDYSLNVLAESCGMACRITPNKTSRHQQLVLSLVQKRNRVCDLFTSKLEEVKRDLQRK
jgi:hypothetical protein